MGYQESLLHIKKRKNQNKFIKELGEFYKNGWNSLADPDFIIELKQDMAIDDAGKYKVRKGEKLIFITGERSHQRSLKSFLWDKAKLSKVINKLFFNYKMIPIEYCMDFMDGTVLDDISDMNEIIKRENKNIIITKFEYYQKQLAKGRK